MAGGEEDCCEGVEEERRTGPGVRLHQPGPVPHHGVVQLWLVSFCLVMLGLVGLVGEHLLSVPPRHTEHHEVDHPEDGDGFEGPVVQVDKHQAR